MTLRILTQLNYSAGANPDADSGLRFTGALLKNLVERDDSLHFYVLTPTKIIEECRTQFPHARITLIPLDIPPRLHGGDFSFDPTALYRQFDFRRYDVDILYLNQAETVTAFLNFFNRQTYHLIPAVTYVHWFDTRRPSTPKQRTHHPALLAALSGLAASTLIGGNSSFGRSQVIREAERWLHPDIAEDIRRKFHILPPPVSGPEIRASEPAARSRPTKREVKATILLNHRLLKYTGVRQALEDSLPQLWSERRDFRVIVTNPSRARLPDDLLRAPWVEHATVPRSKYYGKLWDAQIVLAPHRATHWSISTMEAVCAECLPICNSESFSREMFSPVLARMSSGSGALFEKYCLYYRQNMRRKISQAMDDLPKLSGFRAELACATQHVYSWDICCAEWRRMFDDAYAQVPSMPFKNPSMQTLIRTLSQRGHMTKLDLLREMRWAPKTRTLSWTAFRKALREFTTDDPAQAELVFTYGRTRVHDETLISSASA
jgi:hypothetical protein